MEIRKASVQDLGQIMQVYDKARKFMRENGNAEQWGEDYPSAELIEHDIDKMYLCMSEGRIARLSNMLGGGVIVQRFGDLVRGRRSTVARIEEGMVRPTLAATPGDLSLVLPKRILDGIIEMIYALDKIAPGTANDDTLLYGVEVKFYNMEVDIDENLESRYKGLYIIGDGSGVTHSLSHASASGVYVARQIVENL